ncbi:MAG: hypothetical protein KDA24_01130 [Deltaproteobacteria bacterium]|nr:hypothetical protein [Deltaproteobacteria bacterium]
MPSGRPALPTRARQQALLRDLVEVLADGAAAPFLSNVVVEPYARFFPEAAASNADPVQAMHKTIYAYAGVTDATPALGFSDVAVGAAPPSANTTQTMMLGPVCRRAARAWRRRQGVLLDEHREERLVDLTAVSLGFGALLANHALARSGLDGEIVATHAARDPSVDWRRSRDLMPGLDLGRLLGPSFATQPAERLTATDLVFVLAAQVVVRHPTRWSRRGHGHYWRVRTLDRLLRPLFVDAVRALATPRDALAAQLGFIPMPPPRKGLTVDGVELFPDFDHLLGVDRVVAPRRGPLGRIPGLKGVRLRCSARRCRAPLPAWSPRCVRCGRGVKGEQPLTPE